MADEITEPENSTVDDWLGRGVARDEEATAEAERSAVDGNRVRVRTADVPPGPPPGAPTG